MEGEGFEPSKAEPSDLQSDPFDRSGTPPKNRALNSASDTSICQQTYCYKINIQTVVELAVGIEPTTY
jgi:hypothetical protein